MISPEKESWFQTSLKIVPTDQIGVRGGGERVEGEKRLFGAPRFPNPKSANEKPPKFFQNFVMRSHVSFELSITKIELRGTFYN